MEEKYFKKEKQFLKTHGELLSRISYLDSLMITPELFEKNSKLLNSVIYKDNIVLRESLQTTKTENMQQQPTRPRDRKQYLNDYYEKNNQLLGPQH